MAPQPLSQRQRNLIKAYSYSQIQMTPQEFVSKWDVNYEEVSLICNRSISTVSFWFSYGVNQRQPTRNDMRHLALVDFILNNFQEIPREFMNLLCPLDLD
ncbi:MULTISPECIES: helix-turn-helix domain-containing protein [Cyanophyceae]|uniref:helix-turn-helix domain-containing protein n=1 Tax=Cyanophyceae TaxID=3028117 RepID=UPI001685E4E6|nr:helix-turn-helix domain-containing protein [Trichocoleus sp. FACHB-832]MBD1908347.1 helix-turn-helix domain-containing protein [Trichocoleus sp. FACHB-832]